MTLVIIINIFWSLSLCQVLYLLYLIVIEFYFQNSAYHPGVEGDGHLSLFGG